MTLEQLQEWILSPAGLAGELSLLSRYAASKSIDVAAPSPEIVAYEPDWKRLLFAASVLSVSTSARAHEVALMIAQTGMLFSGRNSIIDASATLLSQLANHRAIGLALKRGHLNHGLEARLGLSEQMLLVRRELAQTVFPVKAEAITTSRFQRKFWDELRTAATITASPSSIWPAKDGAVSPKPDSVNVAAVLTRAAWISASAPTSSGKTYLVLQWLLNEFSVARAQLAVFLAPTRALVGEIERELLDLAPSHQIEGLRIASLPLGALGDRSQPTILIFTQERMHVFLNSVATSPSFDIVIVDEVHKLGDDLRGVILQDAIERVVRANRRGRLVFLSP